MSPAPADLYRRQQERGAKTGLVADRLDLSAGRPLLDVGSGPGYPALEYAATVAPAPVYALDADPAALRYCRERAAERGAGNVRPVVADAASFPLSFGTPTPALVAFVLHHVETPPAVLDALAGGLPPGSPLLVLEYHPEAPGDVGPPLAARFPPARAREWLEDAGFAAEAADRHPEEAYAVLARRD